MVADGRPWTVLMISLLSRGVQHSTESFKQMPVRRVYIPKPGTAPRVDH
jgi:retron-type reverse transcriptase